MPFYELRRYYILPGKMDEWIEFFEQVILPFQVGKGMVVSGIYRGEDDDSCFVWTRRFEDEADRERLYAAVYEDPAWKNEIGPKIPDMMDRSKIQVTRLTPSPKSVAQ